MATAWIWWCARGAFWFSRCVAFFLCCWCFVGCGWQHKVMWYRSPRKVQLLRRNHHDKFHDHAAITCQAMWWLRWREARKKRTTETVAGLHEVRTEKEHYSTSGSKDKKERGNEEKNKNTRQAQMCVQVRFWVEGTTPPGQRQNAKQRKTEKCCSEQCCDERICFMTMKERYTMINGERTPVVMASIQTWRRAKCGFCDLWVFGSVHVGWTRK